MKKNKINKNSGLGSGLSSLLGSELEKKSTLIEENINAGSDYELEICIDNPGVNFYELIGNPDINGIWSPSLNSGYLGFFDPSANLSGDYTYTLSGECDTYQSQVNVNVIEVIPPPIVTN